MKEPGCEASSTHGVFVSCFNTAKFPLDGEQSLSDVKNMIHKLYTSVNVDRHQVHMYMDMYTYREITRHDARG